MENWRYKRLKIYYDFMSEIKADELYDKLVSYGMFSEKGKLQNSVQD